MNRENILLVSAYCNGMRCDMEDFGICCLQAYIKKIWANTELIMVQSAHECLEAVKMYKTNIIGFSMYDINKNLIINCCRLIKQSYPDILICVGGNHATYFPEEIMSECTDIDVVVRGEGELVFERVIRQYLAGEGIDGISGISYRTGKTIYSTKVIKPTVKISSLPDASRALAKKLGCNIYQIYTSRGCQGNCSFCTARSIWSTWQCREISSVIDEIKKLHRQDGIELFNIVDCSFDDNHNKRLLDFCEKIKDSELNIYYFAHFKSSFYKKATEELIDRLVESGLCGACVGIEAGNQNDLDIYQKHSTVKGNLMILDFFETHDIAIELGFINFNPYSSFDSLGKNIDFLESAGYACNIEHLATRYRMYRGSSLYERLNRENMVVRGPLHEYSYLFLDSRIKTLCCYLNDYLYNNNEVMQEYISKIIYYTHRERTMVKYYKRNTLRNNREEEWKHAVEYEKANERIRKELNKSAAEWFRELLHLSHIGWNMEKANAITNKYMGNCLHKSYLQFELASERFKKQIRLQRVTRLT